MRKTRIDEEAETEDNSEDEGKVIVLRKIMMSIIMMMSIEDIGKVRDLKIGQEDRENED